MDTSLENDSLYQALQKDEAVSDQLQMKVKTHLIEVESTLKQIKSINVCKAITQMLMVYL